jgi:GT2 family glycosyltransferase/glycosyltransferase involved in cell wall biosynthesis
MELLQMTLTTKGGDSVEDQAGPLWTGALDPLFWPATRAGIESAWTMHVPFAHWLVTVHRPRSIVELGTHNGVSYAAFCEAVQRARIECRCLAVDTWQGDEHAGFYGADVYDELRRFHDSRYAGFSELMRCTFDAALDYIPDGSIDLLHIDGLHTYDAVRHDFEHWRPKLTDRAIVLFHDTNVRERDFGVWRLWKELSGKYPSFEFLHGHGLGVLMIGGSCGEAVLELTRLSESAVTAVRERFSFLGERWHGEMQMQLNRAEHDRQLRHVEEIAHEKATRISALEAEQAELKAQVDELRGECASRIASEKAFQQERAKIWKERDALRAERDAAGLNVKILRTKNDALALRVEGLVGSTSWRITAPVRLLAKVGSRVAHIPARLMAARRRHGLRPWRTIAPEGFSDLLGPRQAFHKLRLARQRLGSWQEVGRRLYGFFANEGLAMVLVRFRSYGTPLAKNAIAQPIIAARYAGIRADVASRIKAEPPVSPGSDDIVDGPVISIIMPVYRVPVGLLDKAIGSVVRQSYPRWELCIVDDGSEQAPLTAELRRHAASDSRIKLHLSATNAGIAAASNQAIALSTGDYIGFLDHDDALTFDALHWIARAIVDEPDTGVIYTDECKIDDNDDVHDIFCKPDWSPALMLNSMYIGHLSVYRRSLISQVGGLRSAFDFSQDYDLALRVTEGAVKVRHVDRVLYCWRMTSGSAAGDGKPFARQSNIAALQDALDRRGYPATAVPLLAANRAKWNPGELRDRVSVIIPSDDAAHITDSVESIVNNTIYPDYEVIVVTRSAIADSLSELEQRSGVRFARYDKPYNFSDKCNAGAAVASGAYLTFYNDDVRIISKDWIEALLECLQIDGVGAVAPKMLYEDGSIQHAGLVSGVRRLIGTAFHQLPADDTSYYNLAQSLREASSVSGACLVMPTALFRALNGFDAVNTPIAHSDVDLCFRLRDLGYRSVYTPHATLLHIGHQSLATYEKEARIEETEAETPARRPKDKADIHLLRYWPELIAHDPYFPPRMKALLYADSPSDFDIYPAEPKRAGGLDILILSHDLTNSGAPRVVYDMVRVLTAAGHFVVVMAPADGFFRKALVEFGATVIIEPLLFAPHDTVLDFARNFDRVIANTVVMLPVVLQLSQDVDVYWYIHESQLIADTFYRDPNFVQALYQAKQVWANSRRSRRYLAQRKTDVRMTEYGVDAPTIFPMDDNDESRIGRPAEFIIVGSYEPRKGQDLAIAAIILLPERIREQCRFSFFGRILDPGYYSELCIRAQNMAEITIGPELTHDECRGVMRRSDVILCPSRDDSFSLVAMEATGLGKIVCCTRTTGVSDYLHHGLSGFVIPDCTPESIRDGIIQCLEAKADWPTIAGRGREILLSLFTPAAFSERIRRNLSV